MAILQFNDGSSIFRRLRGGIDQLASLFIETEEEKRKREKKEKELEEEKKKHPFLFPSPKEEVAGLEKFGRLIAPIEKKLEPLRKIPVPFKAGISILQVPEMISTSLFGAPEERAEKIRVLKKGKPEEIAQFKTKEMTEKALMAAFMLSGAPTPIKGLTPKFARDILKVEKGATAEEIGSAYKNLIKKEYPRTLEEVASRYKTNAAKLVTSARDVLLKELETTIAKIKPEPILKVQELPKPKPEQIKMAELGKEAPVEMRRMFEKMAVRAPGKGIEELPIGKEIEKAVKVKQMGKGLFKPPEAKPIISKELQPLAQEANTLKAELEMINRGGFERNTMAQARKSAIETRLKEITQVTKGIGEVPAKIAPKEIIPVEKPLPTGRINFGERLEALIGAKGYYRNTLTQFRNQGIPYDEAKWKALEHIEEQISTEQEKVLAEARRDIKEMERGTPYGELEAKFKSFLRFAGEKKSVKTNELFREHIPADIFGVSSDEVAVVKGMSESDYMASLTKDIEIMEGKRVVPTTIRSMAKQAKTLYETLDPEAFTVIKDVLGKVEVVLAEPTAKTLAKIEVEKLKGIKREERYVTRKEIKELHDLAKSVGQRLGPGRTSQQLAGEVAKLIGKATTEGIDVAMGKPYERSKWTAIRGTFIDSIRDYIGKQRDAGKNLSQMLLNSRRKGDQFAGGAIADVEPALKALSDEEAIRFVDIREKGLEPDTPALKTALEVWNKASDEVFNQARKLGLDIEYRRNYFPHFVPQEVIKNARVRKESLRKVVQMGWAETITEAESKLNQYLLRKVYRRYGHLERSREADFPIYERDPRKVIPTYLDAAWHRIADARFLGARDEKAYGLADQIAVQGGDANTVRHMLDMTLGKVIHPQIWRQLEQTSGTIQVLTKFTPMTSAANDTQKIEVLGWVGPKIWTKLMLQTAFGHRFTEADRDWAMRCGELLDSSKRQFLQEAGGAGELVSKYLRLIKFSPIEDLNRIFTTKAGKELAKDTFNRLQRNPENKTLQEALERFGVDVTKALANGELSQQDLINASQELTDLTQYPYRTEELPMAFKVHPIAKILFRWKSFAYFSAKNKLKLGKIAFQEAKHGNFSFIIGMFLAYGVGYQIVGEIMNDLWAFIGRRPRDEKGFARLVDNYLWVGTVFTDMIRATQYGRAGIYSFLTGPDIATAVNLIDAVTSLAKDRKTMTGMEEVKARVKPLARELSREVPIVGPALKGLFFPPEEGKEAGGSAILKKYGIGTPTSEEEGKAGENILKKYGL